MRNAQHGATTSLTGFRRSLVARDPDGAAENARPREQRLLPLAREPYRIVIESLAVGPFVLRAERSNGAVAVSASPASGTKAVFGCRGGSGSFRYAGRERDRRCLLVSHGDEAWQGCIPSRADIVSITFDLDALRAAFLARGLADPEPGLREAWVLPAANSDSFLAGVVRILGATGRRLGLLHEACCRTLEEEVLDLLVSVVPEVSRFRDRPRVAAAARRRALRRAIDYTAENLGTPPRISDLCRVAKTSQRTLEYAFREAHGVSPAQFIKRVRLASARQALIRERPHHTNVLALATRFGFYDAGHFALDYRQAFGELPSVTLRRPCDAD